MLRPCWPEKVAYWRRSGRGLTSATASSPSFAKSSFAVRAIASAHRSGILLAETALPLMTTAKLIGLRPSFHAFILSLIAVGRILVALPMHVRSATAVSTLNPTHGHKEFRVESDFCLFRVHSGGFSTALPSHGSPDFRNRELRFGLPHVKPACRTPAFAGS